MDGHLLPPHLGLHRPGECDPRPQLPRPARTLPESRAGAVGHLQGGHAPHPRDGDTDGADPAAGVSAGEAEVSPGRLGRGQRDSPPQPGHQPRHPGPAPLIFDYF